jgi:hypothetical protein
VADAGRARVYKKPPLLNLIHAHDILHAAKARISLSCCKIKISMNVRPFALLFLMAATLLVACKSQPASTPSADDRVTADPKTVCASILKGMPPHKDPFMSLSAELEGDCLYLNYEYGGGCEEHEIGLYWTESWAESIPPITKLYVSHDAKGDACKAIKSGRTCFNVKPLRYDGVQTVSLDIIAEESKPIRVNYTYPAR